MRSHFQQKLIQFLDSNKNLILIGKPNTSYCLWDIPLTLPSHTTKSIMVPNIGNKINIIQKTFKLVVDPPSPPIMPKSDTRTKAYYFTPEDAHF